MSTTRTANAGSGFIASSYQQAIFTFVRLGQGNGIVSAVAGSGKTTTLVEAARQLTTRSAIFLAFNKHIASHLGQRLRGTPMSARTIHSIGMGTLRRFFGRTAEVQVEENKYITLCRNWTKDRLSHLKPVAQQDAAQALVELVELARKTLTTPTDMTAMRAMAAHFGVQCHALPLDTLIQAVPDLLEEGERIAQGEDEGGRHVVDFTDMIYLPHVWNLPAREHADWVFVDETQDLNAAQLALALKCCRPDGRMLFVGDRHQAIYGFSGADSKAFDMIKEVTHAREFPLSVCYRCPTSHIALAQELVPEIEARADASAGMVTNLLIESVPDAVRKGDLILGRKTAPLVELCIKLIQHRIFAHVNGRDIGVRLTQVVREVAQVPGYHWQQFGQFLEEYQRRQMEKISQFENSGAELVRLNDRVAAVRVCYEMFDAKDAAGLCKKIDSLFTGERPHVLLSTVHQAKGLEANRVFLLYPDEMPLRWPDQQTWELQQERNIKYVALTRAKQALYLVR